MLGGVRGGLAESLLAAGGVHGGVQGVPGALLVAGGVQGGVQGGVHGGVRPGLDVLELRLVVVSPRLADSRLGQGGRYGLPLVVPPAIVLGEPS